MPCQCQSIFPMSGVFLLRYRAWRVPFGALRHRHQVRASSSLPSRVDDLLIFSTEIDVFDATMRRNPRKAAKQFELKSKIDTERQVDRRLQLDEESNVSVALPFIYGAHHLVQTGERVTPDQVLHDGEQRPEDEEATQAVYPFNLFHDSSTMPNLKRLTADENMDDGMGRRVRRKRGRINAEFEAIGDQKKESAQLSLASDDLFRFGTADPDVPSSKIPCGGCGAILHCKDTKMPGFTPSEDFVKKRPHELRNTVCQRCYVMAKYNVALKVSVSPDEYPKTIEQIARKRAIVLLVVDLLDYPGSLWPGIVDLLGPNKKIILVGNKVDMLPADSNAYLTRVERVLKMVFLEKCSQRAELRCDPNIVSTCLVSARTGYNIEKLINLVYKNWSENHQFMPPTDVYLVGTTNVGKSSIFNQLLASDMCKVNALDKVEKAIISPVPGTTLNLLKFPLMRPDPSRIYQRTTRLRTEEKIFTKREEERLVKLARTGDRKHAILSGYVGQSFAADKLLPLTNVGFDIEAKSPNVKVKLPQKLDPEDPKFADGHWCYDTPGTVSQDQVINLLTQEEVAKMMSELPIRPRCFNIKNGQTIFLAGLGRLDLLGGPFQYHGMRIVVFCSDDLPIHMVRTKDADEFYRRAAHNGMLGVPSGGEERLADFPSLQGQEFEVDGVAHFEASCDIVFSSAGWISCVPKLYQICRVRAWTPGGKGIYVRDPPFLPFAHLLKGRRIQGTPAYEANKVFVDF